MKRAVLVGALIALPLTALIATPADAAGRQVFRQNECFSQQEPEICVDNHIAYRDEVKPNGTYVLQFNQTVRFTYTYTDGRVVTERYNDQEKLTLRNGVFAESFHYKLTTKTADCTETVHFKQANGRLLIDTIKVQC